MSYAFSVFRWRDINSLRLAAVFLCITPFTTALSITLWAVLNTLWASSEFPASTASSTFLTAVLHLDVHALLYNRLRSAIRTRLSADFLFGINIFSPEFIIMVPERRLELLRGRPRRILSPLRLPFRHSGFIGW